MDGRDVRKPPNPQNVADVIEIKRTLNNEYIILASQSSRLKSSFGVRLVDIGYTPSCDSPVI